MKLPPAGRKYLLNYFGEEYTEENCGSCDNCDHPREMIDGTQVAKKIVACVKQLPSQYGVALITDVLTGSKSSKVQENHFDTLPAYNSGKEYPKSQLRTWIGELIRQGYLARTGDKYPVIRLTHTSTSIGEGGTFVMLSLPEQDAGKKSTLPSDSAISKNDGKLFLHLRNLRKSIADQAGVPPYVIFPDKSLREMAQTRPCDLQSFRNISGVGEIKLEKYGLVFTSAIRTFCARVRKRTITTDSKG